MAVRGGALPTMALALVFAAVGGCLGGGDETDSPTLDDDGRAGDPGPVGGVGGDVGGDGGASVVPEGAFSFALTSAPRAVLWANDSFAATDSLPFDLSANTRTTDVAGQLQMGLPTRLVANLSWDPAATGRLSLTFRLPGRDSASGGGALAPATRLDRSIEFVPVEEGPYEVVVQQTRGDAGDLAYELRIEVVKLLGVAKPDAPVAVPVVAEGGLVFRMVGEPDEDEARRVTVALWGPDDRFLGRFVEDTGGLVYPMPRDAPGGEYVFMLLQPQAGVTVEPFRRSPANLSMRALQVTETAGERRDVAAGEAANWTFTPARAPIQVGLRLTAQDGFGTLGRGTYTGEIVGRGTVLEFSGPGGNNDDGSRWSQTGHENLTAGPFTVTMSTNGGAFQVEERWRLYERE